MGTGSGGGAEKGPRPFMWTPKTTGENFQFSPTMKALEPYREHLNVFSGLAQVNGRALGDGPGDHARATATFLTGVHPYKTGGADFHLGISADQIAAKELGKYTQLSSLELGLEPQPLAGNCDSGYTCAYMSMSWRGPTSPLPAEINPRTVFERLFGEGDSTDAASRLARLEHQKSVLDYVSGSLSRLRTKISTGDTRKLEEYLDAVRDIERRIQRAEEQSATMLLPSIDRPSAIPDDYQQYTTLMIDMQVVAWQTDMTRVASFMLGRDGSNRAYREIGISDGHHAISHHQGDPEKVEKLIKIDELHVGMFAYLLKKLTEPRDVRLRDAVKHRDEKMFAALLRAKADVNAAQPDGATALAWAVHLGERRMAEALLDAGANADTADEYGESPVTLAAANGDAGLVERLVAAGGNARAARWDGETAVMIAAGAGSLDAVRQLVLRGADVNVAEPRGGQTALMWAAAEGHDDVVAGLIALGANVNAASKTGFTPLVFAAIKNDVKAIGTLVAAGANPNAALVSGAKPLIVAMQYRHSAAALAFPERGADANLPDRPPTPPLH